MDAPLTQPPNIRGYDPGRSEMFNVGFATLRRDPTVWPLQGLA